MKYNTVRFKNGTFGLRRFSWKKMCYVFKDLSSPGIEWVKGAVTSRYIQASLGKVEEAIAKEMHLRDRGEIVKFDQLIKLK